ncbi:oligosaccharide flippase family protein [Bacillus paranthracis]|uniref:oligosaccharide flippase family protein n=1 Tax=Bacillus paranthracis TaxID=2026186 RepID=UPI0013D179AF|nr:oligosaccharide flippase family protein [Bacillus paranthracis]MDR0169668.1 oligosaccharide flippase family protein [Bacillus paranthracis]QRH08297.1 oligosaccharide flippase family protein [Bacillus paranthracis]
MKKDNSVLGGQLIWGSIIGLGSVILGYGIQYIFNITVSRLLGAFEAGMFFTCFALINFLAIISRLGLDRLGLREISIYQSRGYLSKAREMVIKYVLMISILSILLSLICAYFSEELIEYVAPSIDKKTFIIILFSLPGVAISFSLGQYLRGLKKVGLSALVQLIIFYGLVIIFSIIGYMIFDASLNTVGISFFVGSTVTCILGVILVFRHTKSEEKIGNSISYIGSLKATPYVFWVNFLTYIITSIDVLILGFLGDKSQVAYYSAATRTVLMGSVGLVGVNSIMAPLVASTYDSGQQDQLTGIIRMSARWCLIISSLTAVGILFMGDYILSIFGNDFSEGIIYIYILILAQVINSGTGSVSLVLQMTNNEKGVTYILAGIVMGMIPLYYIFISSYGALGAAIVTAMGQILWNVGMVIYAKRKLGFTTFADNKIRIILFLIFSCLVTVLCEISNFPKYQALLIYCIALPFICWKILMLEEDRSLIVKIFGDKMKKISTKKIDSIS